MQDNIITWNLANWVSVVLMALLGFMALGALVAFVNGRKDSGKPDASLAQQSAQA